MMLEEQRRAMNDGRMANIAGSGREGNGFSHAAKTRQGPGFSL
jgi:hypothetical protein